MIESEINFLSLQWNHGCVSSRSLFPRSFDLSNLFFFVASERSYRFAIL